jgi:hypothetical protein
MVLGQDYITIQDFQITQDVRGTNYDDVLVRCWGQDLGNGQVDESDHCSVVGNKIYNAVEPVKASKSTGALFDGNTILGARVAFGSFNTDRLVFRNNEIVDPTDDGVQTKGGTRSAQVYNNLIRTTGANTLNVGIYLGGGSCATCGIYDPNGYEGYGIAAYNNVVVSAAGVRYGGIVLQGCDGCAANNNVVVGPGTAFRTIKGPGWGTNPVYTRNPTLLNNIAQDCSAGADIRPAETTGTIAVDYNSFYNCGAAGVSQTHPVTGDPQFVDKLADWHLGLGSPVRGAGTATSFAGYFGETVPVSVDRDGLTRVIPWSPGIYR